MIENDLEKIDINEKNDYGNNVFMLACFYGHFEIVKLLNIIFKWKKRIRAYCKIEEKNANCLILLC